MESRHYDISIIRYAPLFTNARKEMHTKINGDLFTECADWQPGVFERWVAPWLRHPEDYCQWVRSYLQWRWDPKRQRMWSTRIGGHYRRAACYASDSHEEVMHGRGSLLRPPTSHTLHAPSRSLTKYGVTGPLPMPSPPAGASSITTSAMNNEGRGCACCQPKKGCMHRGVRSRSLIFLFFADRRSRLPSSPLPALRVSPWFRSWVL